MAQGGYVADDIVVGDPFKAGTTWTQRILQQILSNGEEHETSLSDTSPWLDCSWGNHPEMLEVLKQQREAGKRRVIKSHVPADAVPIAPEAKYVFVARNGKDQVISLHNYLRNFSASAMDNINSIYTAWSGDSTPLEVPEDLQEFVELWLDTDGYKCCDTFDIVASWWKFKDQPNFLVLHYNNLKKDLLGQIPRIAEFLSIDPATLRVDKIAEHCSFEYMKGRADKMAPFRGEHLASAESFFLKGPKRDFRTELSPELIARYDRKAVEKLGEQCAEWMETGSY